MTADGPFFEAAVDARLTAVLTELVEAINAEQTPPGEPCTTVEAARDDGLARAAEIVRGLIPGSAHG